MAPPDPRQLANRRRVEGLIGLAAPLLDVVLFAGDRLSRVAGRNDVDPEPPRLGRAHRRARRSAARRACRSAAASISSPWPCPTPRSSSSTGRRATARAPRSPPPSRRVAIVVGPLIESAVEAGAPKLPVLDALRKLAAPGTIYDQPTLQVALRRATSPTTRPS